MLSSDGLTKLKSYELAFGFNEISSWFFVGHWKEYLFVFHIFWCFNERNEILNRSVRCHTASQSTLFFYLWMIFFYLIETRLGSSRLIHYNWNHPSSSVSQQFRRGDLNGHKCHMCNLMQLETTEVSWQITNVFEIGQQVTMKTFSSGNFIFLIIILSSGKQWHYLSIKSRRCTTSPVGDKFCGNLIHFFKMNFGRLVI